jgi:transcriptional regulator with XRE-family HTH domain
MLLIDHYRRSQGLSFIALERLSGIDRATLYRYASGEREPGISRAYAIATALGVTLNQLYVHEHNGDGEIQARAISATR